MGPGKLLVENSEFHLFPRTRDSMYLFRVKAGIMDGLLGPDT